MFTPHNYPFFFCQISVKQRSLFSATACPLQLHSRSGISVNNLGTLWLIISYYTHQHRHYPQSVTDLCTCFYGIRLLLMWGKTPLTFVVAICRFFLQFQTKSYLSKMYLNSRLVFGLLVKMRTEVPHKSS